MIRVVVTGTECTGKTTLARALAAHYETVCVPEFIRQFVIDKGSAPEYEDIDAIAQGQIALEAELTPKASGLLIQDTDLLSTVVYNQHYYGDCPRWIQSVLDERPADLYLLTDIDVAWVPDPGQRDRGDRREEMHQLFRDALVQRRLSFTEIRGSRHQRLDSAKAAVSRWIVDAS